MAKSESNNLSLNKQNKRKKVNSLYKLCSSLNKDLETAYTERNRLVSFITHIYPSYRSHDEKKNTVVYIETPKGQVSFHYQKKDSSLFSHLEEKPCQWDKHTTQEKFDRLEALAKTFIQ